jgi:FKBP-type peptidyl-prolyl cis-trans isomerase 2
MKKGDFIEIDYTGKLAEDGRVFDTTLTSVATIAGLTDKAAYKPVIICLGEHHLLPGLDEFLEGKTSGRHTCSLPAEKAFGKKEAKLLKLIAAKKFKEAKIEPFVGLEVNIDGQYGVVRSVSGGRVSVDFNHPLAGRDLVYEVDVRRVVDKAEEQVAALLGIVGLHHHGVSMESPSHAVVTVDAMLPQPVAEMITNMIRKLTDVGNVTFHVEKGHHQ